MKRSRRALPPPPKKRNSFNVILVLFILVIAFCVLFFVISPKNWNGKTKFSIVGEDDSGNISIEILDPANSAVTNISIPASTEVEAANQLGTWKLGSITKLGQDKNLGGDFLKNTVIKSFSFPIDSSSNLSLLDKLRIKFYLLTIGNTAKLDINLANTNYLNKRQLVDGTPGYQIESVMPTKIESYFTEDFLDTNQNILINNATGSVSVGNMVGKVLQVQVIGSENELVEKISKIFGCSRELVKPANNFDIEVDLGTKFKSTF